MAHSEKRLKFRVGNLRFDEWDGLWRSSLEEDMVGPDEYEGVFSELFDYCLQKYRTSPLFKDDFYIRGDYTGDRTQVLEINHAENLTLDFVLEIQKWLLHSDHKNWRIIIPTYLTKKEVIVIYPSSIRISERYESSLAESIKKIASRMKRY